MALGIIGAVGVRAADLNGEVGIGAIYTDNIRLTSTDTTGDTIGVASTDFVVRELTRLLDINVAANLEYLTYEHDIYSNELFGDLTGTGRIALVPGRLEWIVQDNFGQQQITPGEPVTPLNLENINFLSTGPELNVPLGAQLHAQLSARYSLVSYQIDDLNNNRVDGSAALVHPLSPTSNVSVNAGAERVSYDDSADNPDFTTRQAYLHYDGQGARTKLDVDIGYAAATILNATTGALLVHATLTRALSTSTSLELSAGQDISDAGNLLRQLQGTGNVTLSPSAVQQSDDPFTSRYASAKWGFESHRTAFGLAVSDYKEIHTEESEFDRTRTEIDAYGKRNLYQTLVLTVGASYARETYFKSVTPNDTYLRGTADLAWRLGRRVEMHMQYSRVDYKSDSLLDRYNENRFMLTAGVATENWRGFVPSNPVY
jgi:hypothetical protein